MCFNFPCKLRAIIISLSKEENWRRFPLVKQAENIDIELFLLSTVYEVTFTITTNNINHCAYFVRDLWLYFSELQSTCSCFSMQLGLNNGEMKSHHTLLNILLKNYNVIFAIIILDYNFTHTSDVKDKNILSYIHVTYMVGFLKCNKN